MSIVIINFPQSKHTEYVNKKKNCSTIATTRNRTVDSVFVWVWLSSRLIWLEISFYSVQSHCITMSPLANKLFGCLLSMFYFFPLVLWLFFCYFGTLRDANFSLTFSFAPTNNHIVLFIASQTQKKNRHMQPKSRMFCTSRWAIYVVFHFGVHCLTLRIRIQKQRKWKTVERFFMRAQYNLYEWLPFELKFSHIISTCLHILHVICLNMNCCYKKIVYHYYHYVECDEGVLLLLLLFMFKSTETTG